MANVFKISRKISLKMYLLDPVNFFSAPGLAYQAALQKAKEILELLTDTDMLLLVERGVRGGISHGIHQYSKANNKYMKVYDKKK